MLKASPRTCKALLSMTLNQTMIRVKDPKVSIDFYMNLFQMTLINERHFSDFSLYYLVTLPNGTTTVPSPTSKEGYEYNKSGVYGCTLELTHNHGSENDDTCTYHNGNTTPLGFGHLGFLLDDISTVLKNYSSFDFKQNIITQNENVKNEMTITDPDGYHIVCQTRKLPSLITGRATFHHTMLRVSCMDKSVNYYRDLCQMKIIDTITTSTTSSVFLGRLDESSETTNLLPTPGSKEAHDFVLGYDGTLLQLDQDLTTNSSDNGVVYHNGNSEPTGFGHLAFMVDDVFEVSETLEEDGAMFQKKPNDGRMKGLAFIKDPDMYWIELVPRIDDIVF